MRILSLVPRFSALALAACVALTLTACDSSGPPVAEEDETPLEGMQRRLLVADAEAASLHVLDADDGQNVGTVALAGPAYRFMPVEESGRYAFVNPRNGPLQTIDAGIYVEDDRVVEQGPALHPFEVPGERLIHVTYAQHTVAAWDDGTGKAHFFDARELVDGGTPSVTTVASGIAHHGVAVSLGSDMALLTKPTEGEVLPIGVSVHSMPSGNEITSFEGCPGLHGKGHAAGDVVGFGCSDGMLVVERQGSNATSIKVPNPDDLAEGSRTGTVYGHESAPYLVAHFSDPDRNNIGPYVYEPQSDSFTRMEIPGPSPSFGYAFSPEAREFLALSEDGTLHVFDGETRAHLGSVPGVTSADGEGQIAAGAHFAYVSDPAEKKITEVRLDTREITRTWTLNFAPSAMRLAGTDEPLESAGPAS
ncbi:MAG: hypothetical protein GVY25_14125 [Bacteroidetes bacterium]|jgi:hypothetical protein|nr:hypothetical protein [Bacteroidota bacterium]